MAKKIMAIRICSDILQRLYWEKRATLCPVRSSPYAIKSLLGKTNSPCLKKFHVEHLNNYIFISLFSPPFLTLFAQGGWYD